MPRLSRAASLLAAAALAPLALAASPALADEASDVAALKAQVAALTALVRQQHETDQQQISSLSSEVTDLKAELAAKPVVTAREGAAPPAAGPAQAFANAEPSRAEPRVVQNSAHKVALQSADGVYQIGFTGVVQLDAGGADFRPGSSVVGPQGLSNGFNARRARIGVTGAAGDFNFGFVYDAGNSQDTTARGIQTAQIIYSGIKGAALEAGYSATYFTLDQATSANDLLFMERSSASNIAIALNAGDNRANIGARLFGDRYWLGGYVTGPSASSDSHTLTQERIGAFGRAAFQVLKGPDYGLHLGLAYDALLQPPNAGNGTPQTLSLSDQPELRLDPTALLNTGTIGTAANPVKGASVWDFETAATWKNLFWQGEYYAYEVDRSGLAHNRFSGEYGQVAWSLTGETHAYNPQAGSYFRLSPKQPFSLQRGTWGAWELAARLDYVNLNSHFLPGVALAAQPDAIDGGAQRGLSLGVNWYPNDIIRVLIDYNHIAYDRLNPTAVKGPPSAPLGAPVGAVFDALSLRIQAAY